MNKKLLSLVLLMNVYNVWSADLNVYSSGSSSDSSSDSDSDSSSSGWGTQEERQDMIRFEDLGPEGQKLLIEATDVFLKLGRALSEIKNEMEQYKDEYLKTLDEEIASLEEEVKEDKRKKLEEEQEEQEVKEDE
jgi:hypothetical protein